VGGHITVCSSGMDEVLQFYQTKQVRILAANAPNRHPAFRTPTMGRRVSNPEREHDLRLARPRRNKVRRRSVKVLRDGFRKAARIRSTSRS